MNSAVALRLTDRNLPKPIRVTQKTPSPDAVRKQLSNILQSDGFAHAERMKRFLAFVVEETLAGRAQQLCGYSIGISVFDRDESFEPGLDPIVRNDARRLRQKLLEYYQLRRREGSQQVIIDIPKGGYVPVSSFPSRSQAATAGRQYRVTVHLSRIGDGAEIWARACDFEVRENFGVQLEITGQDLRVAT
jgi:hypothetical protein